MEERIKSLASRMSLIKRDLASANLKKSGKNSFSKFNYFTLDDFEPTLEKLCCDHGVFTYFTWDEGVAKLHCVSTDTDEEIVIPCPMVDSEVKGAQPIQQLGAIQTYMRRYLFMSTFGITEHDAFDENSGNPENEPPKDFHVSDVKKKKKSEPVQEAPVNEPAKTAEEPAKKWDKRSVWNKFVHAFGYDSSLANNSPQNTDAIDHARLELKNLVGKESLNDVDESRYEEILAYADKMSQMPAGPESFKDESI